MSCTTACRSKPRRSHWMLTSSCPSPRRERCCSRTAVGAAATCVVEVNRNAIHLTASAFAQVARRESDKGRDKHFPQVRQSIDVDPPTGADPSTRDFAKRAECAPWIRTQNLRIKSPIADRPGSTLGSLTCGSVSLRVYVVS